MGSNFGILVHRNDENVHLKLMGDFDGTSAHELLSVLKRNSRFAGRTFIHTSCLKDVHPLGRNVFLQHLHLVKGESSHLVFTGDKASQLAP